MKKDLRHEIRLIDYTLKRKQQKLADIIIDMDELFDLKADLQKKLNEQIKKGRKI